MSTIDGDIDSVNHIGVAVRSLNRAAECYEALGFTFIQAARQASAREAAELDHAPARLP